MDKDQATAALTGDDPTALMVPEAYVNPGIKHMVDALVGGVAANVAAPGQLMSANPYPQGSEEYYEFENTRQKGMTDWAAHNALSMMGTGAPFAETGAAGIFGGKLGRTADLRAGSEAVKMAQGGLHPDEIAQATGWHRSPADQQWRYEIPDHTMKLNYMPVGEGDVAQSTVGQLISHPDLFKAYPDLKSLGMFLSKDSRVPTGTGLFNGTTLWVNAPNQAVATSVAAHELQHGVQGLENFSYGADPSHYAAMIEKGLRKNPELLGGNKFMDVVNQADPLYRNTAGEVEARNVQSRLGWGPGQRRLVPPWYSQDVPYASQYHHDPVTGLVKALRK